MADINTTLGLDLDEAFRDLDRLSDAIDRSLGTVEIRLDALTAERQLDQLAQDADRALSDVDVDIDSAGAARLNDELANAERNLAGADREADQLTGGLRRAERAASDVDREFSAIRQNATNLLGAIGVAAGIAGAIRLASDARTAFADLQDSVNAVKVVFGEASGPVLQFADDVAQTAGLSMAAFNQAASVLGSSLINVGFGADEAARKTIELTQRAADMASIFGGEVSVAIDAILSALRGEGNPIERFGVTLTEAKVQAEAAALGFSKVDGEFDSTAKAAARLEIIMRETNRTAGDFANTAGDLANASKIAAAEFENAKASLGETLLPVFQALLDAAPEVLAVIEDLGPSLSSLAVGASNLATATPGMLDFIDVLHLIVDLPRGFGQLFDTIRLGVEGFGTASDAFSQALTGNFFGAFQTIKEGFEGMGDEAQRGLERIQTQGLIDDLRQGGDAAQTLANRLAEVGKTGKLDPVFIRGLAQIAGVDLKQNVVVLVNLIREADRLGLAADDVTALRIALALLSDQGRPEGPIRSLTDRLARIPEVTSEIVGAAGGLSSVADFFDDVELAIGETGESIGEFILSGGDLAESLLDTLSPGDRLSVVLDTIGSNAETAAGVFADSLTPSIRDAGEALIDFNDNGKVSLDEFIRGLGETLTATLNFKTNLAAILAVSPDLFAFLEGLPDQAQAALLAQEAVSTGRIEETAAALIGDPEELAAFFQGIVTQAVNIFRSQGPEAAEEFGLGLAELVPDDVMRTALLADIESGIEALKRDIGFQIEQVFTQEDAANRAAGITGDAYDNETIRRVGRLAEGTDIFDLIEAGFTQVEAAGSSATTTGEAYIADLIETFQANATAIVDPVLALFNIDLTEQGIPAGITLMNGIAIGVSDPSAIDRLRNDIVDATNDALENRSPSHLMLRMGEAAGEAFWSGFGEANMGALRVPETGVTGTATSTVSGAAGGGGGIEVNLTTINPTVQDEVSDVARMGQIASSIAASYRSVVPNGM